MNIFSSIPVRKHKSSLFNMSHEVKLTTELGFLTPIMCQPVLPGDKWQMTNNVMVRLAPMTAPIYHNINVYVHHFFVPNRLIWKPFEDFITGGKDGTLAPALPLIPTSAIYSSNPSPSGQESLRNYIQIRSLWDYLGLPTYESLKVTSPNVSALPFLAYQKIFQDYYRDENLEDEIFNFPISHEGVIPTGTQVQREWLKDVMQLRKRAWRKDYFTSALPWPQRGADVELPVGGEAPVSITGSGSVPVTNDGTGLPTSAVSGDASSPTALGNLEQGSYQDADGTTRYYLRASENKTASQLRLLVNGQKVSPEEIANNLEAFADLSGATAYTINELRTAIKTQEFLENAARGGARYIESIFSHFGVRSSDARMQRAEFLGGGIVPVQIGNVFQTSATSEESPLAELSGSGMAVGNSGRTRRRFEEHGYIMSILSIVPQSNYMQGIPRDFLKTDKYEWYWPEFAHLGEQAIYNSELYAAAREPMGTFGYTPRYAEYKFIPSTVHGDFRNTLDFWHLARKFESEPALNNEFIKVDPTKNDLNRIWNVEETNFQHFYVLCQNNVKVSRRMPRYGVPHF